MEELFWYLDPAGARWRGGISQLILGPLGGWPFSQLQSDFLKYYTPEN